MAKRKRRTSSLPPPPSPPVAPGLISPMRTVARTIPRPDYALTGIPAPRAGHAVRTAAEIDAMRVAGRVAAEVLVEVGQAVAPGVTTDELDAICHDAFVDRGAYPSTLNYRGYPKSCCTSVNEVICHGIPDSRRLVEGDIVNVDVTGFIEGVHGDTNATFAVGEIDDDSANLIRITRTALYAAIDAVGPGAKIYEIGRAIEATVRSTDYGIVREFVGHGIGDQFHTSLQIPHYFDARNRIELEPGMTFTIEPMITIGPAHVDELWDDDWTATTLTKQRTAQFEHTLLVTATGIDILTVMESGLCAATMFEPL